MNQERYTELSGLLQEYCNKNNPRGILGQSYDPSTKECNGLVCPGVDKDSAIVKKLESLGYKVIFPIEKKESRVPSNADVYNDTLRSALVVDSKENPSLYLADLIGDHYYGAGFTGISGIDSKNNSVTRYAATLSDFPDGANKGLKYILDDLGFKTEMDQGNLTISSNIPYPAAKTSKIAKIYAGFKGKMKDVFAKFKAFVNPKEQEIDKDQGR